MAAPGFKSFLIQLLHQIRRIRSRLVTSGVLHCRTRTCIYQQIAAQYFSIPWTGQGFLLVSELRKKKRRNVYEIRSISIFLSSCDFLITTDNEQFTELFNRLQLVLQSNKPIVMLQKEHTVFLTLILMTTGQFCFVVRLHWIAKRLDLGVEAHRFSGAIFSLGISFRFWYCSFHGQFKPAICK